MIELYNPECTDSLVDELDLKEGEHFTIDIGDQENTYFDGWGDVYDCYIVVFPKDYNPDTDETKEFEGVISPKALAYHYNGE